jgi:anti-anti-sigma factor
MPSTLVSVDGSAAHVRRRLPPPFVCTLDEGYVHVGGEIDLATTPELERALATSLSRSLAVVLDLHDVTFLETAGTRAIVTASVNARAACRRLVLLHGPRHVDRLFALTGTADQVTFLEPAPPLRPAA